MKKNKLYQSVARTMPHPGNGGGNGGAIVSSVFVWLVCGHFFTVAKSKLKTTYRCRQCEAECNTNKEARDE